jgi:hypothetical protein
MILQYQYVMAGGGDSLGRGRLCQQQGNIQGKIEFSGEKAFRDVATSDLTGFSGEFGLEINRDRNAR